MKDFKFLKDNKIITIAGNNIYLATKKFREDFKIPDNEDVIIMGNIYQNQIKSVNN